MSGTKRERQRAVHASAPGKLALLGEYAVLDGAPAVVVAIQRRAVVTVRHHAEHNMLIAPEICEHYLPFKRAQDGHVQWPPLDQATEVRLSLMAQVIERFAPEYPVEIETGTAAFYEEGIKIGFGSSAAVTVATASALAGKALSLQTLVDLHRDIQDGRGSGFDVAASTLGGVSVYRARPKPNGAAIEMPDNLLLRCIWTGSAASTTGFLRGLDALGPRRSAIDALISVAESTVASLDDHPASWVRAVHDYSDALQEFAHATTLPIFAGGHAEVLKIAQQHGVAYKPSGAGGGDIGVAVSDDATAMQAFVDGLQGTGQRRISARIDPLGLDLDSE